MAGIRTAAMEEQGAIEAISAAIDRLILGDFTESVEPANIPPDMRDRLARLRASFQEKLKSAHDLSEKDELTGLLGRHSFRLCLVDRLAKTAADGRGALFYCNIDGFRRINEGIGTAGANQLLAQVAMRLRFAVAAAGITKEQWLAGRPWGDEIAFFVEKMDEGDARRCARAIHNAMAEPFFVRDAEVSVGMGIGIASRLSGDDSYDLLLSHAELAMRRAKAKGPSGVHLFDGRESQDHEAAAKMAAGLRTALLNEQLHLVYQPQVDARQMNRVVGVEALLRWRHPEQGSIGPDVFLPLAEQSGLMADIGRWVIVEALTASARWRRAGFDCRMAINLSPVELIRDDLIGHIHEWLTRTGVPPAMFEVEITESAALAAGDAVYDKLSVLRSLGIGVAIDDFGSGYSSFSRLTELPFDRLKIDRSLVEDILNREDRRKVVTCIVWLAKSLGQEVVVEGLEKLDQIELLAGMNCDFLQGFAICPPLREDALLAWLSARGAQCAMAG